VRAKSGVELLIGIAGVETDEDLSDWVDCGLLLRVQVVSLPAVEAVAVADPVSVADPVIPVEPVRNQLRIEPDPIAADPVVSVETELPETETEIEAESADSVEPVDTRDSLSPLTKSQLWIRALQVGATVGLDYRKVTREQIIQAILSRVGGDA
jgi:hypothetical protein